MDVWNTAAEWAAENINDLPSTKAGFIARATREGWDRRKRSGRGGGWEYPLSALPKPAQEAYARRHLAAHCEAKSPAPTKTPLNTALKVWQLTVMEARAALLAEVEGLEVTLGLRRGKAIDLLVKEAGTTPSLADLAARANARAGKDGLRTLSRRSLYRWFADRDAAGQVEALAPAAVEKMTIPVWAKPLLDEYAKPQKPDLSEALRVVKINLPSGVTPPSYDQARRFLQRLSAIDRNRGRMGPKALRQMKAYISRSFDELWPGAVMVGDGHTFKAETAHPIHGRPFRPEVTTINDVYTRRICGWSVALAESTSSVADALRHTCQTSTVPDIFYYDLGSGANNQEFDTPTSGLMARLGITKMNSIAGNSQARGIIEKLHSNLWHKEAKKLPTYIGKDMDDEARHAVFKITRKDIKAFGQSKLLLSWDEFVQMISESVETYNNRPHRSLPKIDDPVTGRRRHQSPNEVWNEAIKQGWEPDVVPEAVAVDLFRPHMIRRCNRCLVSVFSNEYFADALEPFHGEDVQVFYDIHDPSKVWVRDREGRFITTAAWGGNKRSYVPVSAADAAREKRVAGKIRRLDEHRAVALAELSPSALIEHQSSNVIDLTTEQITAATEKLTAMTAPQPTAKVVVLPDGRPRFDDDVSWIKWLTDHPAAVDADDRRAVRSVLSSSPTLRLQLEMAGVAAAAISELLSTEAKVNIA